jgi:hypothetical protein
LSGAIKTVDISAYFEADLKTERRKKRKRRRKQPRGENIDLQRSAKIWAPVKTKSIVG